MKAPPADDRQDVREAGFLGQGTGRDGRYGKWQMGWREIKEVRSAPWALSSLIWVYDHLGKRAYRLCIIVIVICFWATHPLHRKYSAVFIRHYRRYVAALEREGKLPPDAYKGRVNTFSNILTFATSLMTRALAWSGRFTIDDIRSADSAHERMLKAAEHGAFIIGSHVGNMEMLRAMNDQLTKKKINVLKMSSVYKGFAGYLKSLNSGYGLNIIEIDDISPDTDEESVREKAFAGTIAIGIELEERVRNGEWVVMLGDRVIDRNTRYVEADFLGEKARFPDGPWIMASMLDVPCYVMHAVHDQRSGSIMLYFREIGKVVLPRGENRQEALRKYVADYAAELERIIVRSPLDWGNFYDFWHI